MNVMMIGYTRGNPYAVQPDIANGKSTFVENLIEFAGRVCYRSTDRMGDAPDFIVARVREGHEDIVEHGSATFLVDYDAYSAIMVNDTRFANITVLNRDKWVISANLRVWLNWMRDDEYKLAPFLPYLKRIAPNVFGRFSCVDEDVELPAYILPCDPSQPMSHLYGQMTVTLLGENTPGLPMTHWFRHGYATFLIEGVSRTCTHQLVRHRLASFSQESMRYVDLTKGKWQAIIPPSIDENPTALQILEDFWVIAEEKYSELRALGIRKEDARFLLPNAAETRIVATMPFHAWSHFLWLRAVDKAAQWEIRAMGQCVLKMLYAIAPTVFQSQWDVYQEKFVNGK